MLNGYASIVLHTYPVLQSRPWDAANRPEYSVFCIIAMGAGDNDKLVTLGAYHRRPKSDEQALG